ncbi:MAG: hypothetical protein ACRELB_15745 [Polyangiaceae bacterium]
MATWMDVMALARSLRDKRDSGPGLDGADANQLLTLLLAFHERAVVSMAPTESREEKPSPS